jgi:hypothetical protein
MLALCSGRLCTALTATLFPHTLHTQLHLLLAADCLSFSACTSRVNTAAWSAHTAYWHVVLGVFAPSKRHGVPAQSADSSGWPLG